MRASYEAQRHRTRALWEKPWFGWAAVVLGSAGAAWLRWELGRNVGADLPPYITFYAVIMTSSILGGPRLGLVASAMTAVLVTGLFLAPSLDVREISAAEVTGLGLFCGTNLMICMLAGALHAARLRAEAGARELAETLAVLDLASVFVRDPQDRIVRWSTGCQRLYGFTAEQALGRFSHELLRTGFREPLETIRTTLHATGHWEGDVVHVASDGRELVVRSEWVLMRDGTGKPSAIVDANSDLTAQKAAEQALQEEHERLWLATEAGDVETFQIDFATDRVRFGSVVCRILGVPPATELSQDETLRLVHAEDRERLREALRAWGDPATAGAGHLELRVVQPGGETHWIDLRVRTFHRDTPNGRVASHAVGAAVDVTERKQVEARLRLQSTAIEAAPNAIVIAGRDGNIQWVNEAFTRLTGYDASEAIGRNPRLFSSGRHGATFFRRLWETILSGRVWQGEIVNKRKDGTLYTEEMTVAPVLDPEGAISHFVAIKQDISARKEAERGLRENEERYRSLFENLLEGVAVCEMLYDDEGRPSDFVYLDVNPAFGKLTKLRNVRGRRVSEVIPGLKERHPELFETYGRAASGGRPEHLDLEVQPLGWFAISAYHAGERRFVTIFEDITERKRAEAALQRAADQLSRANEELEQKVERRTAELRDTIAELEHFSYSITHDMRAPLRAMSGFSSILQEECRACLGETQRELLRRIGVAARRMDQLILDALDYGKVLRNELPITSVDTGGLLRGMLESYPNLRLPHATIEVAPTMPAVLGNEAGLTQCFSNLLDNAVKFVAAGDMPRVRVWAEPRGDWVRLWIEDNGIGIPEEYQHRIFDMFQRLSTKYEGTGIGLALVRKVAERMGGTVGVESEPDRGSRFWVELRAAAPRAEDT